MVLQELEGFTFATALDSNVGYYTIRLDPMHPESAPSSSLKYSYKRLPMGIAGSPDYFKVKCRS